MNRSGFTLSELLIALGLLGLISVFTVPKVLQSSQQSAIRANLKEAMAAFNEATFQGVLNGRIRSGYNASYVLGQLNAAKLCPTQANSQGCYTVVPTGSTSTEYNEKGIVLPSGAVIVGLTDTTGDDSFWIDGNGESAPNVVGEDILYLSVCYASGCSFAASAGVAVPGKVSYRQHAGGFTNATYQTANQTLYVSLFQ
jgi:prepilin-type N-terminal cleavage/methylation domain-containing protein